MDILVEVKNLGFPTNKYVVVGSGHLAALGLKQSHDIDIVVMPDLFEDCKNLGWEHIPWTYPDKLDHIFLRKGYIELYIDVNKGDFNPTTSELIQRAMIIEGVPFASLDDILCFKKEYSKVNPKHLNDIKLIEDYLTIF